MQSPSDNANHDQDAQQRLQRLHVELWAAISTWAAWPAESISVAKQKAVVAFERALERYATAYVLNSARVHGVIAESVRKTLEQLRVDQEILVKHPKAPASDRSDARFAADAITARLMIALERTRKVIAPSSRSEAIEAAARKLREAQREEARLSTRVGATAQRTLDQLVGAEEQLDAALAMPFEKFDGLPVAEAWSNLDNAVSHLLAYMAVRKPGVAVDQCQTTSEALVAMRTSMSFFSRDRR